VKQGPSGASTAITSARPPNAASGRPPPTIPNGREIGADADTALRAAEPEPQPRDDLVEDQQRPVPLGAGAQPLEESLVGRNEPHVAADRLDDDRCESRPDATQMPIDVVEIVVARDREIVDDRARDPGTRRLGSLRRGARIL
jgi:hypothetical protein